MENFEIPYVIYTPHFRNGLNLTKSGLEENNRILLKETQAFVDALGVDTIIVHPGIAGDIQEKLRQLNNINNCRIIIENKPYFVLDVELICRGKIPAEIKYIIQETDCGFCFDIDHAIYSANVRNVDPLIFIAE